jgi:hypothetical protein
MHFNNNSINGLNFPIKRHKLVNWIKKTRLEHLCKRNTTHWQRKTENENKRMGKDFSSE